MKTRRNWLYTPWGAAIVGALFVGAFILGYFLRPTG